MASQCTIDGCGRAAKAKGLCAAHYQRRLLGIPMDTPIGGAWKAKPKRVCRVEGCGNRARSRGLCHNHYEKWRRGTLPPQPTGESE